MEGVSERLDREGQGQQLLMTQEGLSKEALLPGTSAKSSNSLDTGTGKGGRKKVTIYTDSRYAFGTVHIQGPIYKERGVLTAEGKEVKNLPGDPQTPSSSPPASSSVHSTCPGAPKGGYQGSSNGATDGQLARAAVRRLQSQHTDCGIATPNGNPAPDSGYSSPLI